MTSLKPFFHFDHLYLYLLLSPAILPINQDPIDKIIEDDEETNYFLTTTNTDTTVNNIDNITINANTSITTTTLHDNNNNVHVPPDTTFFNHNNNITVPRVLVDPVNICLPRVADLDTNSHTQNLKTYTDLTHNPGKRRRNAKKKTLFRDSFPPPIIEKIVETEEIEEIPDTLPISPTADTIENTSSLPTHTNSHLPPSHSPIQLSLDKPKRKAKKSNMVNIGYKFQNYFP